MRWLRPAPHRRRRSLLEESEVPVLDDYRDMLMRGSISVSPERAVARGQIRQMSTTRSMRLPAPFRAVFVLRQIEELDVGEVAETLGIPAATVKTRHLRARRRLQRVLGLGLKGALSGKFPFDRARSDRSATPSAAASRRSRRPGKRRMSDIATPSRPSRSSAQSKGRSTCAAPRPHCRSTTMSARLSRSRSARACSGSRTIRSAPCPDPMRRSWTR